MFLINYSRLPYIFYKRRLRWKNCVNISHGLTTTTVINKDVNGSFPSKYNPDDVEKGWYDWWSAQGLFESDKQKIDKSFSMILPPPNITGDLHLGHALTVAIQDSIARWRRANGYNVLWVPGFDHAGIATQVVIEKKLKAETGRLRHQISKQEFIREANAWKDKKVDVIQRQLKSLGASLDWRRQCFTMDEKFERSVTEAFVRLHEEGLIERQKRLVNWCCHLQSAISDIEVDNVNVTGGDTYTVPGTTAAVDVGKLYYFSYPIINCSNNDVIVVATTRPETMFGDVAVAVNPEDNRYAHLIGQKVTHPFDGRALPVISDSTVAPDFGSGCVKITPAHDHRDFEMAIKHDLPFINVLDNKGNLTVENEKFKGLSRFEARNVVISELKRLGLFRHHENIKTTIPVCSRTGDIVEPLLKAQWYLNCSDLFVKLVEDINNGKFNVQPESSKITLLTWLNEKRKWCISRQLWWGHQIPAYKMKTIGQADQEENWVVARTVNEAICKLSSKLNCPVVAEDLERDEDVLDTWFSSGLFPFAVFGWPDVSELQPFYPLSLMETGYDIIFFWVARMAILGEKLTGKKPFSNVLVHGLICDRHGKKMSKSVGNVIDPEDIQKGATLKSLQERSENLFKAGYINTEELKKARKALASDYPNGIQQCGTDALRFSLLSNDIKGQDINLDVSHVESCKPFCNKIWQTCRFFLFHLERMNLNPGDVVSLAKVEADIALFDRWILNQLSEMIKDCNNGFNNYDLHLVTNAIRKFWVSSLCDVYLEGIKPILYNEDGNLNDKLACLTTLSTCIQMTLVAVAPVMPYLSEELYQRLKLWDEQASLSVSLVPYPSNNKWARWLNPRLPILFDEVIQVSSLLRQLKVKYSITKLKPEVYVVANTEEQINLFNKCRLQLEALGGCHLLDVSTSLPSTLTKTFIRRDINPNLSVGIDLLRVINKAECVDKLTKDKILVEKKLHVLNENIAEPNKLSRGKYNMALQKISALKQELVEIESSIVELSNFNL